MSVKTKAMHILVELKGHAPFTALGALAGILFMLIFRNVSLPTRHAMFMTFHPAHVVLSAMVTASMFKLHAAGKRFLLILVIGYFGSVGIATLSDIIIPHFGAEILDVRIPTHAQTHYHSPDGSADHRDRDPEDMHWDHKIHLGFIEEWYIVNPAAFLGVIIAYFLPHTKFPHSFHILISTWASSSYLLMSAHTQMTLLVATGVFIVLFIAVWVPCCVSDIVFPLLFVKSDIELAEPCPVHARHSHPHLNKEQRD
jgi:hypothetical protein